MSERGAAKGETSCALQRRSMGFVSCGFMIISCGGVSNGTARESEVAVLARLISMPELKLDVLFDVESKTVASAFVENVFLSGAEPTPIFDAHVTLSFDGYSVTLGGQDERDEPFYLADSVQYPSLTYVEGLDYTFSAAIPSTSTIYGGGIRAPKKATLMTLTVTPFGMPISEALPQVRKHPRNTDLGIGWPRHEFERVMIDVYRADTLNPAAPHLLFQYPVLATSSDFHNFILNAPPTEITIPASIFTADGVFAVVVTPMSVGAHNFTIFAGSGVALLFAVGDFSP
jgi:hypothetical protein